MRGARYPLRLFVSHDGDNISPGFIPRLSNTVNSYSSNTSYHVYGDFEQQPLSMWRLKLNQSNIKWIQQKRTRKNATDNRMIKEILDRLVAGKTDIYIIVSGDADFLDLCRVILHNGKQVIVIGHRGHTSQRFAQSGIPVMYIEDLP